MITLDLNINNYLSKFLESPDQGFELIFNKLSDDNKDQCKLLLIYLDKVVNRSINLFGKEIKFTHIHFNGIDPRYKNVIAEFIVIKFFFLGIHKDNSASQYLNTEINRITKVLKEPLYLPSGVKGGSRQEKIIKDVRTKLRVKKAFFEELATIKATVNIEPKTLLNTLAKQEKVLEEVFSVRPFCIPINLFNKERSYVLINTDLSRDVIDNFSVADDKALLDVIENIIIFDCEGRQVHREWNFKELNEWKKAYETSFKNLVIFSFGEFDCSFNALKGRIEKTQSRYHSIPEFPDYECYVIPQEEIEYLITDKKPKNNDLQFFGEPDCSFWQDFKFTLQLYEGLYELKSFKMMNIYSLGLNELLQKLILEDIFDLKKPAYFITKETKGTLSELSSETIEELKSNLNNLFKWFNEIKWTSSALQEQIFNSHIIIPELVRKHPIFLSELLKELGLASRKVVLGWKDMKGIKKELLCFDYRDFGPFPYTINPNAFQPGYQAVSFKGLFIAPFFKHCALWNQYNYSRDIIKLLDHPIRRKEMDWLSIYNTAIANKPDVQDSIDWGKEWNYQSNYDSSSIKIRFKDGSRGTFPSSELFVYYYEGVKSMKVDRLENLLLSDLSQIVLYMQRLENLYSDFNIYEKIANKTREEAELQVIKRSYGIKNMVSPSKLWKVLLQRKADEIGLNILFEDIKAYLNKNSVGIVSKNTFKDCWMEPDSNTLLPRGTKIFLHLCEYLKIPRSYFRIMLRIKNAEIQSTRNSSKQMNELLSDLFNDGCFDKDNVENILLEQMPKYIKRHNFDEIGIPIEHVVTEVSALIHLLKPHLDLLQVENAEIN